MIIGKLFISQIYFLQSTRIFSKMDKFFAKAQVIFGNCLCERDDEDSECITFTRLPGREPTFNLKTFFEDMDKLVDETEQLRRKINIDVYYRQVSQSKKYNMFDNEIPHIITTFEQFTSRPGDFSEVTPKFFHRVDKKLFVKFDFIQIVFTGINDE